MLTIEFELRWLDLLEQPATAVANRFMGSQLQKEAKRFKFSVLVNVLRKHGRNLAVRIENCGSICKGKVLSAVDVFHVTILFTVRIHGR